MKHSKSVLLWLFVILMFCAVSFGGCGGGSSSSSKSSAPNEDVANNINGENNNYGGGDDNYGGDLDDWEVYNNLYYLNGTTWKISKISVYREYDQLHSEQVPVTSYNFNFSTLKFMTTSDSFMPMDDRGVYYYEPITVTVNDSGYVASVPIIWAASDFKEVTGYTYDYIVKPDKQYYFNNVSTYFIEETILIRGANSSKTRPFTRLKFNCTSSINYDHKYSVFVELEPAK